MRRRLIALGDLHGDVHRLVRILERQQIVLSGTRKWARAANDIDLVLLGDYVDWRGEPLEGEASTWDRGAAELLELIVDLHQQVDAMAGGSRGSAPRFYTLLGNHEQLMLDSYRYLENLSPEQRRQVAQTYTDARTLAPALHEPRTLVARLLGKPSVMPTAAEVVLTWMLNGGVNTVNAFGGFDAWYERMRSGLARFIEEKMPVGVVINRRLYAHSLPDSPTWWQPVDTLANLDAHKRKQAVDAWIWGRRVYGFDHKTGKPTPRPEPHEIDQMLAAMQVQGAVVGHSLMQSLVPVRAYEGRIVNIDLHGHPLSDPWIEEYLT